jgi:hypothetical protein
VSKVSTKPGAVYVAPNKNYRSDCGNSNISAWGQRIEKRVKTNLRFIIKKMKDILGRFFKDFVIANICLWFFLVVLGVCWGLGGLCWGAGVYNPFKAAGNSTRSTKL